MGPPGATPVGAEPRPDELDPRPADAEERLDDERLLRERPPHHDQER